MVDEKLYSAEAHGSGTFIISKPKTEIRQASAVQSEEAAAGRAEIGTQLTRYFPVLDLVLLRPGQYTARL